MHRIGRLTLAGLSAFFPRPRLSALREAARLCPTPSPLVAGEPVTLRATLRHTRMAGFRRCAWRLFRLYSSQSGRG